MICPSLPPSSPGMEFVFQVTGSGQIRPICPRRKICESHDQSFLFFKIRISIRARRRWVEVSGPPTLLGCSGCGCRHRELHGCRAALRRRPCRGGHRRLAQVASVSGAGFALLAIGNCLPPFVIPALLALASPSPPFRKCHMLPCLLATMVVFPLFLHIFHTCALSYMFSASMCLGSP